MQITRAQSVPPTIAAGLLTAPHVRTFNKTYATSTTRETAALVSFPPPPPPVTVVGPPRPTAWRKAAPIAATRAHHYSRNWAGAVVPATGGERFSLVTGSWTVPKVERPANHQHDRHRYVSIWVGLGGSYQASNSMPQVGSEHGWDGTKLIHRLWCQWWLGPGRKAGYLSHYVENVTLVPGDPITVWLDVHPGGTAVSFHWACGDKRYGVEATAIAPVMADSANWIVERPTEVMASPQGPLTGGRHPLPLFPRAGGGEIPSGEVVVSMTECLARLGPSGAMETVRRPSDGALLSMRSVVPGASRSFIELEPAMTIDPPGSALDIVRHLP